MKPKRALISMVTILMAVSAFFSLSGCAPASSGDSTDTLTEPRFVLLYKEDSNPLVGRDDFQRIYVDRETGVMYLFVKCGYGGGLTVMVSPDGTPMIYEGFEEVENDVT